MTEPVTQPELNAALDRLWTQFLPEIEQRVATIESASSALVVGELKDDLRDDARSAAHKLAGVLGTFGLTKGTIVAREAELLLSGDTDPASAPQLTGIAGQLRTLIASKK